MGKSSTSPRPVSLPGAPLGRCALAALFFVGVATVPACSAPRGDAAQNPAPASVPEGQVETVVDGLQLPWSAVFVGDEVLVSERDTGLIKAFRPGEQPREIGRLPSLSNLGDGGLLGLETLTRDSRTWVYAFYTGATDNRIVRMAYSGGRLGEPEVVLDGIPSGAGHNGGRLAFGPDGMLYATTGETRNPDLSQDPDSLAGKILRMTPEGAAPADNPDPASLVYARGLRNPQGLAWDAQGRLWATDFGDDGWDELNQIQPGRNYGWPAVEGRGTDPAYVNPVVQWRTQEAGPSGLAFVDGTLFVASLTGQRIWAVTPDAASDGNATPYFVEQHGRIRDVMQGPGGRLWFLTGNVGNRRIPPQGGGDRILAVSLATTPARPGPSD